MKPLAVPVALSVCVWLFAGVALGAERTVVVPKDNKPIKVSSDDLVRLTGSGIAGSKMQAKISGPAEVDRTNVISERQGGAAVIGNSITEYEIKPTGKGKVKVTITVTPPQAGAKPKVTVYQFHGRVSQPSDKRGRATSSLVRLHSPVPRSAQAVGENPW